MRKSVLLGMVVLALLSVAAYAADCPVVEGMGGAYSLRVATDTGFSGDEETTGAYLGVDITDVTPERLSALKLKDERGVEVTIVDQDAPAGKAGLKEHDVILTMNGSNVDSGAQLRRMIRETPPGRVVAFGVSRDGQPLTIKVQLADRRKSYAWSSHQKDFKFQMPPIPPIPPMPDFDLPVSVVVVHSSMRSGLMVENLTPQLADFFGAKNGKGVLVRSVEKGSRAEKSGFRAGDVIVRVNDQSVQDTSDFSHAIRSNSSGTLQVGIIRDKKEQNLTLPLPERKDSGDLFEEQSLENMDIDAETHIDLSRLQSEMAQLRPQMQYAIQESRRVAEEVRPEVQKALRAAKSAQEQVQHELCSQQQALKKQTQKMQKDLERQRREMLRENKRQIERLRHEMQGDWMQI
ncbi:MAG TPA: PDZ domain-containing protein [Terriglobales bacterium]|jgi:serine protease Do|nr:PDZ domain-containing protein [Terriglobales bacterium]